MQWIQDEIDKSKIAKDQVDLGELWRPGVTKLEKLKKCLETMFCKNVVDYSNYDPLSDFEHTNFDEYFPKDSKDFFGFLRNYIKDTESVSSGEEETAFIDIEYVPIDSKENIAKVYSQIILSLM